MTDIGDVIKYLRTEKGYTQRYLADCCGIGRQTVWRIELTGNCNLVTAEKILGFLGYELEVVPTNGRADTPQTESTGSPIGDYRDGVGAWQTDCGWGEPRNE